MATAAELTFVQAVVAAEAVRQTAKTAAFRTWAYQTGSPLSTYVTAVEAADNAYITAINSALSTAGGVGITVPNQGPSSQTPVVVLGGVGLTGPLGSYIATYGSVA